MLVVPSYRLTNPPTCSPTRSPRQRPYKLWRWLCVLPTAAHGLPSAGLPCCGELLSFLPLLVPTPPPATPRPPPKAGGGVTSFFRRQSLPQKAPLVKGKIALKTGRFYAQSALMPLTKGAFCGVAVLAEERERMLRTVQHTGKRSKQRSGQQNPPKSNKKRKPKSRKTAPTAETAKNQKKYDLRCSLAASAEVKKLNNVQKAVKNVKKFILERRPL